MASNTAASTSVTSGGTLHVALEGSNDENSKDIAVCVDGFNDELVILRCTASFGALCGPSASGMGLLEWVVNEPEFTKWFQNFVNMALEDETPRLESSSLNVKLKP